MSTNIARSDADALGIVSVLATMSLVRNVSISVSGAYARHLPTFLAQQATQRENAR